MLAKGLLVPGTRTTHGELHDSAFLGHRNGGLTKDFWRTGTGA